MNVSFYSLKCQNTSDRILIDNGLQYVLYTCASPLPVSACLVQKVNTCSIKTEKRRTCTMRLDSFSMNVFNKVMRILTFIHQFKVQFFSCRYFRWKKMSVKFVQSGFKMWHEYIMFGRVGCSFTTDYTGINVQILYNSLQAILYALLVF